MESNHKKGQNRKVYLKKHRKTDDRPSFNPRSTFKEENEKPILFQLGSIASYGVGDFHHKANPKNTNGLESLSLSTLSASASSDLVELSAKERKSSVDVENIQLDKELLRVSSRLSDNTPRSQVSGVTYASLEPASLSPTQSPQLQMMDREEAAHPQTIPTLEKDLSTISNESLFSLSIGDNTIGRDELFSYRDFKPGEGLKSGELLSFSPSIRVPVGSTEGRSSDMDDKESEATEVRTSRTNSEDKSSNSNASWRNLTNCNNPEETPTNIQPFSSPITKKNKKKKKVKKKTQQHQQQQQQKKRCSWLCCFPSCKNTWSCFSCSWCGWPSCSYGFSCCKRLKCLSCSWPSCNYQFSCCKRLKCCSCTGCYSCSWLFCCHWCCCCCSSRSKKVVHDEIRRGSEEH